MARIEAAQMARYADPVKDSKASSGSSPGTEFSSMLKGKEQAAQDDVKGPKAESGNKHQGSDEVKGQQKDEGSAAQLPETEAGAQVPAEVMLQLQAALNQLMENPAEGADRPRDGQPAILAEEAVSGADILFPEDADTVEFEAADAVGADAPPADGVMFKTAGKHEAAQALPEPLKAAISGDAELPGDTEIPGDTAAKAIPADTETVGQAVENADERPEHREVMEQKEPGRHGDGQNRDSGLAKETVYTHGIQEAQDNRTGFNSASVKGQGETVTVRTSPETFPSDVGKAIAAKMPGANGTLTIELEPAALGRMTIKVIYEAGRAAVSIMSENPKTLELLSQSAGDIAQILEQKTGQQTVVYTPENQQDMDGRQGGQESGRQRQDREEKRQNQPDSFAQQLRLGLV